MLEKLSVSKYLKVNYFSEHKTLTLEATEDYLPPEAFKKDFKEILKFSEKESIRNLIFDKSNLDVFHQKSMEWYFVEITPGLFENGLQRFYKVLPNKPWFNLDLILKSTAQIKREHPEVNFSEFDSTYVPSVEYAMNLIEADLT